MTYDWTGCYKAAVLENNWSKMKGRIQTADAAIAERKQLLANIVEFWEPFRMKRAIAEYLRQDRWSSGLKAVDLAVARTLGEGLARSDFYEKVGARIERDLSEHVTLFEEVKTRWKALLLD